jgi:hypothetical protein
VTVTGVGTLEYNATLDNWVCLTDSSFQFASFDAMGRQLLMYHCLLVYDGDPWANFKPDVDEGPEFARLLTQMDDKNPKVREATTSRMARELYRFRSRIIEATDNPLLSSEVQARLKSILPDPQAFPPAPPPLFRTMHPVLQPRE